jgi:hypothetical protein
MGFPLFRPSYQSWYPAVLDPVALVNRYRYWYQIRAVWVAYSVRCSCRWKVMESVVGRGYAKPAYCGMDESSSRCEKDYTTIA